MPNLNDLNTLLGLLSATPGVVLLIGLYFYWSLRQTRKDLDTFLNDDWKEFQKQYREDMDALHNNGFVHKDVFEEVKESLDGRLDELAERFNAR